MPTLQELRDQLGNARATLPRRVASPVDGLLAGISELSPQSWFNSLPGTTVEDKMFGEGHRQQLGADWKAALSQLDLWNPELLGPFLDSATMPIRGALFPLQYYTDRGLKPTWGLLLDALASTGLRREIAGKDMPTLSDYTSGRRYEEIAEKHIRPNIGGLGQFVFENVADPVNYVPGVKLARGVEGAFKFGQAARISKLAKAELPHSKLQGLQVADPLGLPGISREAADRIDAGIKQSDLATLTRALEMPANQLVDDTRALSDAITEMKAAGFEMTGRQAGTPPGQAIQPGGRTPRPVWPTGANPRQQAEAIEAGAWESLEDEIGSLDDPLAQLHAIQAKQVIQNEITQRWSREAAGAAAERASEEAGIGAQDDIWAERHGNVMLAIETLRRMIKGKEFDMQGVPKLKPMDTAIGRKIIRTATDAIRGVRDPQTHQLLQKGIIQRADDYLKDEAQDIAADPYSIDYYRLAEPIYVNRNNEIQKVLDTTFEKLLQQYQFSPEQAADITSSWLHMTNFEKLFSEVRNLSLDLPTYYTRVSSKSAEFLRRHESSIYNVYNSAVRDRRQTFRLIDNLTITHPHLADKIAEAIAPRVDEAGMPINTEKGAMQRLADVILPTASNEQITTINRLVNKWTKQGYDLLEDDPMMVIQGRFIEARARALGIKAPTGFGAAMYDMLSIYKINATLAIDFPVQNYLGIALISKLHGYSLRKVVRNMNKAILAGARGESIIPTEVNELLKALNWEIPPAGTVEGFMQMALSDAPVHVSEIKPQLSKTAVHKIPVAGRVLGPLADKWRDLYSAMEVSGRLTVWYEDMVRELHQAAPKFLHQLTQDLNMPAHYTGRDIPGVPGAVETQVRGRFAVYNQRTGRTAVPTPPQGFGPGIGGAIVQSRLPIGNLVDRMKPGDIEALIQRLAEKDGRFSVEFLRTELINAGAPVELVDFHFQKWADILRRASDVGVEGSKRVNLDYAKTDKIEHILQWVIPFIKFPKRMLPRLISILSQNPKFLWGLNKYMQISQQETRDLPPRFRGQVSLGLPGRALHRVITGRPGRTYTNPLAMLLPFAGALTTTFQGDEGKTLNTAEQVWDWLQQLGFSPAGYAKIPSYLASGNPGEPAPRLFRHSQLIEAITQALTGTPMSPERTFITEPLAAAQAAIRAAGKGETPESQIPSTIDFRDYNTRKRILEMGVEADRPHGPEYEAAIRNPLSPIHQQAEAETSRADLLRQLFNFIIPSYVSPLSDTERMIRTAEATVPKPERDQIGNLTNPNEAVRAWLSAMQDPLTDVYSKKLPPVNVDLIWNMMKDYYPLTPSERSNFYKAQGTDGPVLRNYISWLRSRGKSMPGTRNDVVEYIRVKERR